MSSSKDSEKQRRAIDKAREGSHCTEHPNLRNDRDMRLHGELFRLGVDDPKGRREIEGRYIAGNFRAGLEQPIKAEPEMDDKSGPSDSEQRGAVHNSMEGARLLNTGDYEGAIKACTEAIQSGNLGAYLIRAQAYNGLGMVKEAEADRQKHANRLGGYDNPDAGWTPTSPKPKDEMVIEVGAVLLCLFLGMVGIIAPWVSDVAFWWPTLLGVTGLLVGLIFAFIEAEPFLRKGIDVSGTITQKRVQPPTEAEVPTMYYISLSRKRYTISEELYYQFSEGDAVDLRIKTWLYPEVRRIRHSGNRGSFAGDAPTS